MIMQLSDFLACAYLSKDNKKASFYLDNLDQIPAVISSVESKGYLIKYFDGTKFIIFLFEPNKKELDLVYEKEGDFVYYVDENYDVGRIPDIEQVLKEAIRLNATDIHIEPKPGYIVVRFRIDGDLHIIYQTIGEYDEILNKIKIFAGLDTMNREIEESSFEFMGFMIRVSSVPTLYGEKLVFRLLHRSVSDLKLNNLGLTDEMAAKLKVLTNKKGIHLICGPTGSGKNTTLHSLIKEIDSVKYNIISIEDPVEYRNENITQLEVDNKRDRTFDKLLRSILRQDPDVLYIGEIRDGETAEVAFRSAITGHIVFSTLHTKDVESTFDRLYDLNLHKNLVKAGLKTIVNQRLVKILCEKCKKRAEAPEHIKKLGINYVYQSCGCDYCNDGYKGRLAIFSINAFNDKTGEMEEIISMNESILNLLKYGKIDIRTFEAEYDL
ncbi:MAG: Flp pilus assembly complex ATPase component TadA [Ezakiella sp.]|nr:Flp pilus assembly complex ATPase component TadA [Ezakiella sp.]MDD7472244.1 ATPase, T2SS/T4P/T4SS family [Bacillota bacterium]MDY3923755.1 ATPase, T2SS/T4P/T4SS family [Ezakiella sp.]